MTSTLTSLWNYFEEKPYTRILVFAFILRLVPLFFSQGFYAHDDHYLIVEVAQEWLNGSNASGWFVDVYENNDNGRSAIYPGIIYGLLWTIEAVGIYSPTIKMFIISFLHVLLSLTMISLSMKITALYNKKAVTMVGLLLAGTWLLPFLSVRTLIEMVAIPPLLYASYLVLSDKVDSIKNILIIGFMFFLAFTIRYQTVLVAAGIGIELLRRQQFKQAIGIVGVFLFLTVIIHGYGDYLMTTKPFGKLLFYFVYNVEHAEDYLTRPVFDYIGLMIAFLFPPMGILFFGLSWTQWKKALTITLGILFFFVIHSVIPNKQERFVFTLIPFFFIVGSLAYYQYFPKPKKWLSILWSFSIVSNIILMGYMSTFYSKQSRVEVMKHIGSTDAKSIAIYSTNDQSTNLVPQFYAGRELNIQYLDDNNDIEKYKQTTTDYLLLEITPWETKKEINMEEILDKLGLSNQVLFKTRIKGSLVDRFRYKLNSVVKNKEYLVYKITKPRS